MARKFLDILSEYSAILADNGVKSEGDLVEEKVRLFEKHIERKFEENVPSERKLTLFLCDILMYIATDDEAVISKEDNDLIYLGLMEIVLHGICRSLPESINPRNVLKRTEIDITSVSIDYIPLQFIEECVSTIEIVLRMRNFSTDQSLEMVCLHQIASLVYIKATKKSSKILSERNLLTNPEGVIKKDLLMRYLLLLKGSPQLPREFSQVLHEELTRLLHLPGGFLSLANNIVASKEQNSPQWKKCETLAKIIASPGHGSSFYLFIVEEIASEAVDAIERGDDLIVEASIVCLNSLHGVKSKGVKRRVEEIFVGTFKRLSDPEESLTGVILLDNKALTSNLKLNARAFRGSVSGAKSSILVNVLPILFELHAKFPDNCFHQEILKDLIVKCLSNRSDEELHKLVEIFLFGENHPNLLRLHPRVMVKEMRKGEFSIQIGPVEDIQEMETSGNLLKILKQSNHNLLTYNVLKILFGLFEKCLQEKTKQPELGLLEAEDVHQVIEETFKRKTLLIVSLSELLSFQPIHFLLRENPQDIVPFILNVFRNEAEKDLKEEVDTETVIILMSILREFVAAEKTEAFRTELIKLLRTIQSKTQEISQYIDIFLEEIIDEKKSTTVKSKFQEVRQLCDEKMPHIRVYGMSEMIKLIEQKDVETLANLHSIFHVVLQYLSDEDSYSFLTCIRLLVLLTMYLNETAIETLVHEYENPDKEMDFRLKVGEVIVKITESLGQMAFKFKGILISCFLRGSGNPHNEFRTSSLYNLGNICRLLTYQIHNFFHEMINTIYSILQTDKYLPSRRAAILTLAQILEGVDNLLDFQDFLLPTYRLLKSVKETEVDERCRIHAENGLKVLNEKVKKSLHSEAKMQKEIKIFGIKDEEKRERTSILEI
ncbi:transport and Golgi organization protein 6 isoform X2 [Phlebotomus argentipes]|uniref:transport and Golgi organization protein 6 isoform X2 n=1 Tax=Phlebotomus argentipes TaxID=94469 RepID=UPI0028932F14|nr:transport and Golgi organization protein 6 isoform X2 [Phlebotomus argentipes]